MFGLKLYLVDLRGNACYHMTIVPYVWLAAYLYRHNFWGILLTSSHIPEASHYPTDGFLVCTLPHLRKFQFSWILKKNIYILFCPCPLSLIRGREGGHIDPPWERYGHFLELCNWLSDNIKQSQIYDQLPNLRLLQTFTGVQENN